MGHFYACPPPLGTLDPSPGSLGAPWVIRGASATLALCCLACAVRLACRRRDGTWDRTGFTLGGFALACGCALAMPVFAPAPEGTPLAGFVLAAAATAGLAATALLLGRAPAGALADPPDPAAAPGSERPARQGPGGRARPSPEHFRQIVEGIRDYSLILLDPGGAITHWSPGAERMTGYRAAEVVGQSYSLLFTPEELAQNRPALLLRSAASQGRVEYEGWRAHKDGTRFPVSGVITALSEDGGALQGFVKVTRDISQQKASQEALKQMAEDLEREVKERIHQLRESETKLQGFIQHAPAAIAFKDLDGRFLHINARMEQRIGLPAAEILGRTNDDLFPEEICAPLREHDSRVLRHRHEVQVEEHWPNRADGTTRDYLSQKFPLVDATGTCWGMGLIDTDITERKKTFLALQDSQKLESLGVLAGGIAHDFNNLLAAMKGNLHVARNTDTWASAQPYFEALNELMDNAADLLKQVLTYAGKGQSVMRTLDLNRLVEDLVNLLRSSLSRRATLRMDLHPEALRMLGDPSQIQQVVMNLVINASEALADQDGTITIRTSREQLSQELIDGMYRGQELEPGDYVALEVADDGMGMAPEVLAKIFDPFFTTKLAGRGLGLASLRDIVRNHRGGIRVDSTRGLGSTFKLRFPEAPGEVPDGTLATFAPKPAPEPGPGPGSVLVVDDEERIRSIVTEVLGRAGFRTLLARDGREALETLQQHRGRIRLILMNLAMPNLDGAETCRELRRRGAEVPVLLISGFAASDILPNLQDLGLQGFLQKPFEMETLVRQVRQFVHG